MEVSIILSRPFLAIGNTLMDIERGDLKFLVNDEEVSFNICETMKKLFDFQVDVVIDVTYQAVESVGKLAC